MNDTFIRWPTVFAELELSHEIEDIGQFYTIAEREAMHTAYVRLTQAGDNDRMRDWAIGEAKRHLTDAGLTALAEEVEAIQRLGGDGTDLDALRDRLEGMGR